MPAVAVTDAPAFEDTLRQSVATAGPFPIQADVEATAKSLFG